MTTLLPESSVPQSTGARAASPQLGRVAAAAAGVVAAGFALAVTEIVSVVGSRHGPSVVSTVASRMVDLTAGALKNLAVSLFGTNDKAALLTGIVVISLIVGAALGVASIRRKWVGSLGFVGFAVVGVLCARSDPQASNLPLAIASLLGAAAGVGTLRFLSNVGSHPPQDQDHRGDSIRRSPAQDPRVKTPDRRAFLLASGTASAAAVVLAVTARRWRGVSVASRSRAATLLPDAKETVGAPATQPFAVDGVSPFITPNADFYRIDTAIFVPQVNVSTWKLTIDGMVDRPVSFTYTDLLGMDLIEQPITISCVSNEVGGDLVGNARWRGVPLNVLLDRAGVKPGATQIVGRSVDGFTVGFPTEKALDGRVAMVAVGMNGEPLPIDHGYPARLIVAGLYGYVSATKWLKQIQLTRLEDFDAYWIPRGWAKQAPIKTQSRIDTPRGGQKLVAGPIAIAGVAWAPTRGITRVEVQVDNEPWQAAQLGETASANTWVQWLYRWDAPAGRHHLRVRATDGTGQTQTAQVQRPEPDGATGYHTRTVTVA